MHLVAYLIPVVAVVVMALLHHDYMLPGQIWYYLLHLVVLECIVGIMHALMHAAGKSREYLGAIVTRVCHYFEWTEKITYTETETKSDGSTRTVTKVRYEEHPEEFCCELNTGGSVHISENGFWHLARLWGTPSEYLHTHHHNCVEGGGGEAYSWDQLEEHAQAHTFTGRYTNPLRGSNSIFRYTPISDQEARKRRLHPYPEVHLGNQNCVVAPFDIPRYIQKAYAYINGIFGREHQIHIFVLLYDATQPETSSVATADDQRAYWEGGNKNEFTLCIGVEGNATQGMTVRWAHAFSWMDEPTMAVPLESWLRQHPTLDLMALNHWFRDNIHLWKRKEFSDFRYIHRSMHWWQLFLIFSVTAAATYAYFHFFL